MANCILFHYQAKQYEINRQYDDELNIILFISNNILEYAERIIIIKIFIQNFLKIQKKVNQEENNYQDMLHMLKILKN